MRNRTFRTGWSAIVVLVTVGALTAHPTACIGIVLLAGVAWFLIHRRAGRLWGISHDISATDTMSGPEFERYVAALMRRSGFRRVRISGGAGDMGADIIAFC